MIGAELLHEICQIVGAQYDGGLKEFRTGRIWRIRIEDQREHSDSLRFVLDVGEDKVPDRKLCLNAGAEGSVARREISYCANRLFPEQIQTSGTVRVYVAGNFGNYTPQCVAVLVANAYFEASRRHLPEWDLLANEKALRLS